MQYLVSVIHDRNEQATDAEAAAIDAFNERIAAAGHRVFAGGLSDPSSAAVIDNRGGRAMVTAGPFAETAEFMIGFWIVEAPDLDVALALGTDASKACHRKVEVRPFL